MHALGVRSISEFGVVCVRWGVARKRNDIAPPACHCPQCVHMQNRPPPSGPRRPRSLAARGVQRGGRIGAVQNSPCRPQPARNSEKWLCSPARAHSHINWISNQLPSGEMIHECILTTLWQWVVKSFSWMWCLKWMLLCTCGVDIFLTKSRRCQFYFQIM